MFDVIIINDIISTLITISVTSPDTTSNRRYEIPTTSLESMLRMGDVTISKMHTIFIILPLVESLSQHELLTSLPIIHIFT